MHIKRCVLLISAAILLTFTGCSGSKVSNVDKSKNREVILNNDNTNEERNLLLKEDIKFLKQKLPELHKNPFSIISREEFNEQIDQLIENVDQLNNKQVLIELNKIVASIGDAHTSINIRDGLTYPLQFYIFDGKVCVVNADTGLEEMMFSEILKIDGVDINIVMEQLTTLISHENESWLLAMLPSYLRSPVYMCGLGIIQNEKEAVFTVQKDGKVEDFTVTALDFDEKANFINEKVEDVLIGKYDKYYDYEYLPEQNAVYFMYNVCADMENQEFKDFNNEMFKVIERNHVNKIIIDLRNNTGGNSEILNPFTNRLKSYDGGNNKIKVYTLVGRNTFSSGMFAIYRIKESVPEAVSIGEPTGGALDCYGEIKTVNLPNTQIPMVYSTKYFEFSKSFRYKNAGVGTFVPDIFMQPTIEDYKNGSDAVLDYVLSN